MPRFPAASKLRSESRAARGGTPRSRLTLNFFAKLFQVFTSFPGHRMAQLSPALAALMPTRSKAYAPRTRGGLRRVLRRRGAMWRWFETGRARWKARNPVGAAGTPRVSAALALRRGSEPTARRTQSKQREVVMRPEALRLPGIRRGACFVSQAHSPPTSAERRAAASRTSRLPYAPPPQFSWTGLYIGAHVGYGWSDLDWQFDATPGISTGHTGGGGLLGGQIGYNVQVRQFVFGVEADMSGAWHRRRHCVPERGLRLQPQLQLAGLGARPRRHRRQRQPHAALRHGGRAPGPTSTTRRPMSRPGPRSAPASTSATAAGWPAAASSTC